MEKHQLFSREDSWCFSVTLFLLDDIMLLLVVDEVVVIC